jgi:two-component system alkaline phosphatase synthesis response regulator PhoP
VGTVGKILLVDDHPDIVRLLQYSLRDAGHQVLTALGGERALELVRQERPEVVVLDVVMPDLDGYRVLNRIKTDPELRHTMVIMLTVKDQAEDVALGLDIGADFYLSKPFRPDEVAALVQRVFDTQVPSNSSA